MRFHDGQAEGHEGARSAIEWLALRDSEPLAPSAARRCASTTARPRATKEREARLSGSSGWTRTSNPPVNSRSRVFGTNAANCCWARQTNDLREIVPTEITAGCWGYAEYPQKSPQVGSQLLGTFDPHIKSPNLRRPPTSTQRVSYRKMPARHPCILPASARFQALGRQDGRQALSLVDPAYAYELIQSASGPSSRPPNIWTPQDA